MTKRILRAFGVVGLTALILAQNAAANWHWVP